MTQQHDWAPGIVDPTVPSAARVYDYVLGGNHNFAVDREMAEQAERALPGTRDGARMNRAFLARAVRFMVAGGVRQFLDVGSGIPTVGNVHEIARAEDPSCRVVYVDRDPIAVAHSELMLAGDERTAMVEADMRDPDAVLGHVDVQRLLDFSEPVGLLFLMVLHWITDGEDPVALVSRYRERLVPDSQLAITHLTDTLHEDEAARLTGLLRETRVGQVYPRSRAGIAALFGDFELLPPGVVPVGVWRPAGVGDITGDVIGEMAFAGIAVK